MEFGKRVVVSSLVGLMLFVRISHHQPARVAESTVTWQRLSLEGDGESGVFPPCRR